MKDAYYFSHDSNARNDAKIMCMRSVYGYEGYGWFWLLVEMMREETEHKITIGKYTYHAIAMQMQCEKEKAQAFIEDCINEFGLFESDGESFWSPSLRRRMELAETKSKNGRKAAKKRWEDDGSPANDATKKQTQCEDDADASETHSKNDATETKTQCEGDAIKESKGKEKKDYDDDDNARVREVLNVYQNEIGIVSPVALEKLHDSVDMYSPDWVIEAIHEAVRHNARSMAYVEKCLSNWKRNGFKVRPAAGGVVTHFPRGIPSGQPRTPRAMASLMEGNG